jgi:hypothetical protein
MLLAYLAWVSLAYQDLSGDTKSQISNTCKSIQICITSKNNTNSTRITHTPTHILTLELNLGEELVGPAGSG